MGKPLVIIGSGLAGYMTAKEWRKYDKETPLTIITADDGAFYSKPLLSNALTKNKSPDELIITPVEKMREQLNATILTHQRVEDLSSLGYQKLVLACGASTNELPSLGVAGKDYLQVNTLSDYRIFHQWLQNKKHIAIVGSGLVGCEFANDLLNKGFQVSMVATDRYPLLKIVPEKIGEALKSTLIEKGLRWYRNIEEVEADGVLVAIGLKASLSLAKAASLKTDKGILVDEYLQTSDPMVFALGDCAQVNGVMKQHIAPILLCARALAKTLSGDKTKVEYPPMPIIVKTPALPIVSCVPFEAKGEWRYEGDDRDIIARLYAKEKLVGFALSGECVKQQFNLLKEL